MGHRTNSPYGPVSSNQSDTQALDTLPRHTGGTGAATAQTDGDDLTFSPSPGPAVGLELELQIVDRETGDLSPGARRILQACEEERLSGVTGELMQSMIEVKTGVCKDVHELRDDLISVLRRLCNIARSLGYELAIGGSHPFHRISGGATFPADRCEKIMGRMAWFTYCRTVFGLHVHVGVASGDDAIAVMNLAVQYLPHLLALSANSPFWQGIDTGFSSCRAALYGLVAHSGVPPYFPRWRSFRSYFQMMRECRALGSTKDIYWDIRPRPELGTVEFRICDAPATLATVLGLAAVIRSLSIFAQRLSADRPPARSGDIRRNWLAVENRWLAARYGLGAMYIRTPSGKRGPLRHDVDKLIERLSPIASESRDAPFFRVFQSLDRFDSGAEWQRRRYREIGSWRALTEDIARRLADEVDRHALAVHTASGAGDG